MKRFTKAELSNLPAHTKLMPLRYKNSLYAVIALTGVAMTIFIWAIATTQGARWLLKSITTLSKAEFSVQKIEGRIIDHLVLTKIRVALAPRTVELDTIDLRWQPLLLLAGKVTVQELTLNGVRIEDDTPIDNKTLVADQPDPPGTGHRFDVKIALVRITDLSYRRLQDQPRQITSISGSVTWQEGLLSISGLKAAGLKLIPELNIPTDLSGTLNFSGTMNAYHGDLTLINQSKGWQAATVSVVYAGTPEGMQLAPLTASFLEGTLAGRLNMNWQNGIELQGEIKGTNLNPAGFDPAWKGVVNFSTTGKLAKIGKAPLTANFRGALLESRLHGQTLTGELQAEFAGDNLTLTQLALQGKGFNLQASGELNQRLTLAAEITDFSRLVPGSSGRLRSTGWVRWSAGHLSSAIDGTGSKLAYAGTRIAAADLTVRLDQGAGSPLHIAAALRDVHYNQSTLKSLTASVDGTLARHTINAALLAAGAKAQLTMSAGFNDGTWKGEILRLAGNDGNRRPLPSAPKNYFYPLLPSTLVQLSISKSQ